MQYIYMFWDKGRIDEKIVAMEEEYKGSRAQAKITSTSQKDR